MNEVRQWYDNMDASQRKVFYFVLAVVAALVFLWMPSPSSLLPHFGGRERPVIQKPVPGHIAAPPAPIVAATPQPVPVVAPVDALPPVGDLLGKWHGQGIVGDRGMCNFALEVKTSQPGKFAGFSNLACMPMTAGQRTNAGPRITMNAQNDAGLALLLGKITPTSSIMSGIQEADTIKLHVDEATTTPAACGMTELTLRAFGSNAVLAKWTDGCTGGGLTLQKAR